ncbi:hypothetical protein HD806DRAFT_502383 [Xylariaceae sp. AK1471]|nr:hypothetical protein HD806DRAFT_502383 [Xylariaceae sp. AK1471]
MTSQLGYYSVYKLRFTLAMEDPDMCGRIRHGRYRFRFKRGLGEEKPGTKLGGMSIGVGCAEEVLLENRYYRLRWLE